MSMTFVESWLESTVVGPSSSVHLHIPSTRQSVRFRSSSHLIIDLELHFRKSHLYYNEGGIGHLDPVHAMVSDS